MRSTATTRILLLFTITALVTVAPCTANDAIHNIFMAAAQECEWLRDAAISSVLMTEASHENLALAIFCDPHDLDFGGDRKIVSLAVTASDGQTRTLNISSNVDERYSRFATEKCWLAGKPVIVLTGWYWTSHLSPTVYMIDETGVFFKVSGGDFVIENGKVINFAFSVVWAEQGALPFVVDDDLDMAYCNYQSMYSIAPHVREIYAFDAVLGEFILIQETPVTQYAVIGAFLAALQADNFDAALQYLSEDWRISKSLTTGHALRKLLDSAMPDLVTSKAERFVAATDYSIRFQMQSGSVYDAVFDRTVNECYMSWRVSSGGEGTNIHCNPPRIIAIRKI